MAYTGKKIETKIYDVYTKDETDSQIANATPDFSSLEGKPTTLSGYGITDAYTQSEVDTAIGNVDLSNLSPDVFVLPIDSSNPVTATEGTLYFNDVTYGLNIYSGGKWSTISTLNPYIDDDVIWFASFNNNNRTEELSEINPTQSAGTFSNLGGYNCLYLNNEKLIYPSTGVSSLGGNNTWTVEYWIYKTTGGDNPATEIEMGNGSNWYQTGILDRFPDDGSQSFYWRGSSYSVGTRTLDQWVHAAIVGDNGTIRHYENGVQKGASSANTAFDGDPEGMYVGGSQHTTGQTSVMYIRNLRISNVNRYPNGTSFLPSVEFPIAV
jgi:hypothetical protein